MSSPLRIQIKPESPHGVPLYRVRLFTQDDALRERVRHFFNASFPTHTVRWNLPKRAWDVPPVLAAPLKSFLGYAETAFGAQIEDHTGWFGSTGDGLAFPDADLSLAEACRVLHLLPSAVEFPSVVRAAYRALSLIHHPDHGGDLAEMQKLTVAYATIERGWPKRAAAA